MNSNNRILRKLDHILHPTKGVVLMLHRVTSTPSLSPETRKLEISPAFLEQTIIKYRNMGYWFASIGDVARMIQTKQFTKKPFVCFTLDDGYLDNLLEAVPVFRKYNVPYCIYVTTGLVTSDAKMWWYEGQDVKMLSIENLKQLASDSLCTIGAHTVTHCHLTQLSYDEKKNEIVESKQILTSWIGREICHFSYPHGDFDEECIDIVKNASFESATMAWGGVVRKSIPIYSIPRVSLIEHTFLPFISGDLQTTFQKESRYKRYFTPSLQIKNYKNAIVLPSRGAQEGYGGVVDEHGQFVPFSAFTQGSEKIYHFDESRVRYIDEDVCFLGVFHYFWGHALIDNFRHSWVFFSNAFKKFTLNANFVYVTVDNKPISDNIRQLFRLANIDIDKAIHITELTRFRTISVPDDSVVNCEYGALWSPEYKEIIDTIKTNVSKIPCEPNLPENVYFTRTLLPQSTRDLGEPIIENVFKKMGYTIVAPERLSVASQIQIVMNCKSFAATEGSVAHNSIFAKPHTEVVLIMKAPFFNPYQWMVNDMAQLKCTYIEAQNSFKLFDVSYGPFLMVKSKYLCEYANIKYHNIPNWLSIYYWGYRYKLLARIIKKIRRTYVLAKMKLLNSDYVI